MTHFLTGVLCGLVVLWLIRVAAIEIRASHHRGRARIHRGTSWSPRIPHQETRQ